MPQILCQRISFGYSDALFEALELTLSPGHYALVGPNGCGKSSLLRLLTGQLTPQQGRVRWVDCQHRILCEQAVDTAGPAVEALATSDSGAAIRMRADLRLDALCLPRWSSLSPGERKRWQIGAALYAEPELLALDEPTNHLDLDARNWITAALRKFRGISVVVSHDRAFLDALCRTTLRLEHGKLSVTPGNYSQAQLVGQQEEQSVNDRRRELDRVQSQLQRSARASRNQASAAERDRNAGRRMKSRLDHDASCILQSNQAESAGQRHARQARTLEVRRDRVTAELEALPIHMKLGSEVFADFEAAPKASVLRGSAIHITAGSHPILTNPTWNLRRGERVWLTGPNGSGKTTLLQHIIESQSDSRILYLPQEMDAPQRAAWREQWLAVKGERRARQMTLLAALGTDPEALLRSADWSAGELRKAMLSAGLANRVHTLVLDEPTNHIDLPSIERLERLLLRFPGSILLATHDTAFAERVTDQRWRLAEGTLICSGPIEPA